MLAEQDFNIRLVIDDKYQQTHPYPPGLLERLIVRGRTI